MAQSELNSRGWGNVQTADLSSVQFMWGEQRHLIAAGLRGGALPR
jgi:hypothetical protein